MKNLSLKTNNGKSLTRKAQIIWHFGLIVMLTMVIFPPAGQAQHFKGLIDLGEPHFSPAARPLLEDIPKGGIGYNFKLIDHNPLIAPGGKLPRGGGGFSLAVARNCAYASSGSNNQGILIIDISNPRRTKVVGEIPPPASPPSGASLGTDSVFLMPIDRSAAINQPNPDRNLAGKEEPVETYSESSCK